MKSVYVGMSGGVDSSMAAALLQESGYDVTGVYMKNWSHDLPGFECPWEKDLHDAKNVASKLRVKFKVFDFEREYKQKVVDYMVEEYANGRTPNPDVMCNQEIKFKLFLKTAIDDGADLIATGHYAHTARGRLYMAKNKNKDQTYFLYRVSSNALERTLFPISIYTSKEQVRSDAKKRKLTTAEKKDSQGICFIGQVNIKNFLGAYVKTQPGSIIDEKGVTIGEHEGAVYYTVGQRHGLHVGGGLPYYVTSKNMKKNEVYVTTDLNNNKLWNDSVLVADLHWIRSTPDINTQYSVRLRHSAPLIHCTITQLSRKSLKLSLAEPVRAVTSGQSAVLYNQDECIGGGIVVG